MTVCGIDLGNKSRNGIAIYNHSTNNLIDYSYLQYDCKSTAYHHRKKILDQIHKYDNSYDIDYIVFEKVNLFRGKGVSPLANIVSLSYIQATIINEFSEYINISGVDVRTWKSRILGTAKATKEDSIKFVQEKYPYIDLKIPRFIKSNPDAFDWNHDLADAICISMFDDFKYLDKNIMNFK